MKVVAWSMIVMFIEPMISIRKRKTEARARERSDLARTLMLYADATKSWLSKCVRFPVATLEQVKNTKNNKKQKKIKEKIIKYIISIFFLTFFMNKKSF